MYVQLCVHKRIRVCPPVGPLCVQWLCRVQRGGSPFAGGEVGILFCVSTPHPAYGVSDDFGNGKGEVCRFPFHKKGRV